MDENRLSGTAKKLGGKVEEGLGRVTSDATTQAEGQLKHPRLTGLFIDQRFSG